MLQIKILGSGCPKCKLLEANALKAVKESGKKVEIIKIDDIGKIIEFGVMSTPAIVVDGEIKSYGEVVSVDKIREWL